MLRGMSSYVYIQERLHPGMLDGMVRGGAQVIEVFGSRGHFDYTSKVHVKEIAGWFKSSGITFNSMHSPLWSDADRGRGGAPGVNLVESEKRRRIESMDEIKRALEVAETSPFRFLIQHIGLSSEAFDLQKFEYAITAVEHLRAFARPLGVSILLENIPNEFSTPDRLLELIRAGRFEDVGVCFDLGHAHIMNNVAGDFELLAKHIQSTHVHDNRGEQDSHLWPGDGTIEWGEAIELLRTAHHVPPLLLEIEGGEQADIPSRMTATFKKIEEAVPARR